MRYLAILAFVLLTACSGPVVNMTKFRPEMTKAEVLQNLGQPEGASFMNGVSYLYFTVHDHAFGRDKNRYVFAFQGEKLLGFNPLPEDQQEQGLIDRALKRPSVNIYTRP